MTQKEWVFPNESTAADEQAHRLVLSLGIPLPIARVMVNRGFGEPEVARSFLEKDLSRVHDPFLLADMNKAVRRIRRAIADGEKITVYGDYDVDGITSVALLVDFLRERGADVGAYIPDRQNEGYGVNRNALEKIAADGTKLVITVDTGITAVEEMAHAAELGLDVIITDHHECKSELPRAEAVVNPKRGDCTYPFKELAGVGVAFKLVCAIDGGFENALEKYADTVALGTIADVVSLTDENRAIADVGIKKMMKNPNRGIAAVLKLIGTSSKWNSSGVIGYSVAPRLNAAGRMSSAMPAVELLLTDNDDEAARLAGMLDEENSRRRSVESVILAEAEEMLKNGDYFGKKVLVLAKRGWHHGIIGVVASRICDKYNKSCILISVGDNVCKCSGRSVEGLNLFDALGSCADVLEEFGGHAYAAGFSVKKENIAALDSGLNAYADGILEREPLPKLYIDARIDAADINLDMARQTEILAPYGAGNKVPVFALTDVTVCEIQPLSMGKHCRLICEKNGARIEVIAFGMGDIANEYRIGDSVDVAGELNINCYNGSQKVQLVLSGIRLCRQGGALLPTRTDFADAYRCIRRLPCPVRLELRELADRVFAASGRRIRGGKLLNALRVFDDVGILSLKILGNMVEIRLSPDLEGKKVNLNSSKEYIRIKTELEK